MDQETNNAIVEILYNVLDLIDSGDHVFPFKRNYIISIIQKLKTKNMVTVALLQDTLGYREVGRLLSKQAFPSRRLLLKPVYALTVEELNAVFYSLDIVADNALATSPHLRLYNVMGWRF